MLARRRRIVLGNALVTVVENSGDSSFLNSRNGKEKNEDAVSKVLVLVHGKRS
jgi:hypothetical protein